MSVVNKMLRDLDKRENIRSYTPYNATYIAPKSSKRFFYTSILAFSFCFFLSCNKKVKLAAEYIVSIDSVSNSKAPALQSFTHGIYQKEWLLFAGRTNKKNDKRKF